MAISHGSFGADRQKHQRKRRVPRYLAEERQSCCIAFPVRRGAYSVRMAKKLDRLLFILECDKQEGKEQDGEVVYRVKLSGGRTFQDVNRLLRHHGFGAEYGPFYSERSNDLRGAVIGVASGSGTLPLRCEKKNIVRRAVKARLGTYSIRGLIDLLFGEDSGDRGYHHIPIVCHGEALPDAWDLGAEAWLQICAEYPVFSQVYRAVAQSWDGSPDSDLRMKLTENWAIEWLNLQQYSPILKREKRTKIVELTGGNRAPYDNPEIGLVWEHFATGGHYQYGAGI